MCPKHYVRRRKLPTRMMIRRGNGVGSAARRETLEDFSRGLAAGGENPRQFLRGNDFELRIGTVARLLVCAPPSKMRYVTEAGALHVLVGDFDHQFGSQWLPREVLPLAPAALAARHTMPGFTGWEFPLGPVPPRVRTERVLPIRHELLQKFAALFFRKARADADVLKRGRIIEKT